MLQDIAKLLGKEFDELENYFKSMDLEKKKNTLDYLNGHQNWDIKVTVKSNSELFDIFWDKPISINQTEFFGAASYSGSGNNFCVWHGDTGENDFTTPLENIESVHFVIQDTEESIRFI